MNERIIFVITIVLLIVLILFLSKSKTYKENLTILPYKKPVDAVYTFVNDTDPYWAVSKQKSLEKYFDPSIHNHDSIHPNRFRNMDELKYSLRSLNKFVPWINKIYLVVASQKQLPKWFKTTPKMKVIIHSDIISNSYLPTFNSHAIEANLHRIPGLSNIFIYINDDLFFGRPIEKHEIVTGRQGKIKIYPNHKRAPIGVSSVIQSAHSSAWRNTNEWLNKKFKKETRHRIHHTISVLNKKYIEDLWNEMKNELTETTKQRFRSIKDYNLTCALHPYYVHYKNGAESMDVNVPYIELTNDEQTNRIKFEEVFYSRPFVFCLNDTSSEIIRETKQQMKDFLEEYFPEPSPFEIQ